MGEEKKEPVPFPKDGSVTDKIRWKLENDEAEMCCCCVCQCSDRTTKEYKCCIIFPIKCGVQFIALMVLLTALAQFLEVFYQLLNDHIDWWYVLVGVFLNVPIIVAFAFVITFFNRDEPSSRVLLRTAVILTIITLTLSAIWNAVYFWFFYKHDEVVTGNDGVGFTHATRKQEIVFSSYIALVLDCFFAYFLCVIANYIHAYDNSEIEAKVQKYKEEEAAKNAPPADNEKEAGAGKEPSDPLMEEKKDEEKKDEGGEAPAEEPKEEAAAE